MVGGEKKKQQAQASLLERWPIQQRSAKAREATCHTSAPQSHYSNPTLVPYFMIECKNDVRLSKDNATFGSPTYSGDSGSNVLDGRERTIDKASGHLIVQNMKA